MMNVLLEYIVCFIQLMYNNDYYLFIQYIGHLLTMRHKILMIEARDGQYQNHVTIYHESNITIIDIIMISFKVTVTILYATKVVKIVCNKFIDVAIL